MTRTNFSIACILTGLILYMRAIQGHSGATKVDLSLLDDVLIGYRLSEHLYHLGCSWFLHSFFYSGLLAGGKDTKEGRQTVFFTALDLMSNVQKEEYEDVSKPRKVHYKNKWKVFQDATCWFNLRKAQIKDQNSGRLDPMALSFTTLCQPTLLKEWQKINERDSVSESFMCSACTTQQNSDGSLAGSTRRFSSAWYQYGEIRGGRGKEGA